MRFSVEIAGVSGPVSVDARRALRSLAGRLGFDPKRIFGESDTPAGASEPQATTGWWSVLQVGKDATSEQIEAAYREKARQNHPDRWHNAAKEVGKSAERRMKEINAAVEAARLRQPVVASPTHATKAAPEHRPHTPGRMQKRRPTARPVLIAPPARNRRLARLAMKPRAHASR